jgi:hypothetical protein
MSDLALCPCPRRAGRSILTAGGAPLGGLLTVRGRAA